MPGAFVSLLTDFGTADPWVAICKGVILRIVPAARLLDISHDIPVFGVRAGAFVLAAALPELPVGTHLAVVDPGVGTVRRPIAIRTARGDSLVGPDNGLLIPATEALGGIIAAHELVAQKYRGPATSNTFHGRDIFAPAAGHLAHRVPIAAFGPALAPGSLVRLHTPGVAIAAGALATSVLYVDGYGNIKLAGSLDDLTAALGPLAVGDPITLDWAGAEHATTWGRTFADALPGRSVLYRDSLGLLSLAVNQGSAGALLRLEPDVPLRLRRW